MSFGKAVQDPYAIVIYYEDVGKRNYFPSNSNQYGLNILTLSNGTKVRSTRKSLRNESPYHSLFLLEKNKTKHGSIYLTIFIATILLKWSHRLKEDCLQFL